MENRNFKLDTEWNMIHYPEKPTGFGILIIGDERNFVDEKTSFWTQNEGKLKLIQKLNEQGYTVFYSNLYGKNWGSDRAVYLARSLYEFIIRSEIINHKIHILAEGMGALVAMKLLQEMKEDIRSIVLLNPIVSLKAHLEQEEEHKFFYKQLLQDVTASYGMERNSVIEIICQSDNSWEQLSIDKPVKIIHVLSGNRAYKQSKLLNRLSIKWENEASPIAITYLVPQKKNQLDYYIVNFYKSHETPL